MTTDLKDCIGREIETGDTLESTPIKLGPGTKESFQPEQFKVSFQNGRVVIQKIGDAGWGKQSLHFFNDTMKIINR